MVGYIFKCLFLVILVLFGIMLMVFLIMVMILGDLVIVIFGFYVILENVVKFNWDLGFDVFFW